MDDPFACFDAAPAVPASAATTGAHGGIGKRPRPSPVLALIRRFATMHAGRTTADLQLRRQQQREASCSSPLDWELLASELDVAAAAILAEPPDLSAGLRAAEAAASLSWDALLSTRASAAAAGVGGGAAAASASSPLLTEAYTVAQYLLCGACAASDDTAGALRALDRAFILGGMTEAYRDCSELLDDDDDDDHGGGGDGGDGGGGAEVGGGGDDGDDGDVASAQEQQWRRATAESTPKAPVPAAAMSPVARHACPPTADAFRALHRAGVPVVLEGVASGWAASRKWSSLRWLKARFGARLVPVEVGSLRKRMDAAVGEGTGEGTGEGREGEGSDGVRGGDMRPRHGSSQGGGGEDTHEGQPGRRGGQAGSAWGERIMSLAEFVDAHLMPQEELAAAAGSVGAAGAAGATEAAGVASGAAAIGYLAQHPLFEQLPRLRRDFGVPAACGVGSLRHVNAWLGPKGTVTPLHFDSYDNILTNVVGYKRVRLYSASQTPLLYPIEGGGGGIDAQGNVSAVDVESADLERFPAFARAEGNEVVLGPGEGLFIPAGCWHHVRSLSTAFSISFWF